MKNEFFEQKMFNNFEGPMQKLMELNVKMMQNLSLMKPMDLLSLKKPEDIFERNMELFIQNSHMTLNYMRETFNILEHHWFNISRNMEQNTKKAINEASSSMKKNIKTTAKTVAKKATSSAKKASSAPKKASSPAKKASAKKNTKAAAPKTNFKQAAKSTPAKSTVMHAKVPTNQNAPKMTAESPMSKVGSMAEKSGVKDLGIQNINKSNSMPN